jgi:serine/threonine protein kinase
MGSVYAAWDPRLGRRVAIKLLHAGPWSTERHALRLEREARTLGRLNHENVVRVFDVGEWEGKPFLTMEFVDGKDLVAFIAEERPSREAIVRLFMQAGHGLVAAHALGVVHRDVKGQNIFVGADGRARIGDFGIARLASETTGDVPPPGSPAVSFELTLRKPVTLDGVIVGTPKFMAPEQLEGGRVDARSDQFSLCVALWIAVFGEDPFPASSTLLARFERTHAPPHTPLKRWPALEVVVARGLAFDEGWHGVRMRHGRAQGRRSITAPRAVAGARLSFRPRDLRTTPDADTRKEGLASKSLRDETRHAQHRAAPSLRRRQRLAR